MTRRGSRSFHPFRRPGRRKLGASRLGPDARQPPPTLPLDAGSGELGGEEKRWHVRDDKIEMRRREGARRKREKEKASRQGGETKCANKANMRADLQPGGQRYFHEFLGIVGINFPPLFSGDPLPFYHSTLVRSLTAGSLIPSRSRRPLPADAA